MKGHHGRTENLEEERWAGTGGHSQLQLAHLQIAASGAQVYLGWGRGAGLTTWAELSPHQQGAFPSPGRWARLCLLRPQLLSSVLGCGARGRGVDLVLG